MGPQSGAPCFFGNVKYVDVVSDKALVVVMRLVRKFGKEVLTATVKQLDPDPPDMFTRGQAEFMWAGSTAVDLVLQASRCDMWALAHEAVQTNAATLA